MLYLEAGIFRRASVFLTDVDALDHPIFFVVYFLALLHFWFNYNRHLILGKWLNIFTILAPTLLIVNEDRNNEANIAEL